MGINSTWHAFFHTSKDEIVIFFIFLDWCVYFERNHFLYTSVYWACIQTDTKNFRWRHPLTYFFMAAMCCSALMDSLVKALSLTGWMVSGDIYSGPRRYCASATLSPSQAEEGCNQRTPFYKNVVLQNKRWMVTFSIARKKIFYREFRIVSIYTFQNLKQGLKTLPSAEVRFPIQMWWFDLAIKKTSRLHVYSSILSPYSWISSRIVLAFIIKYF